VEVTAQIDLTAYVRDADNKPVKDTKPYVAYVVKVVLSTNRWSIDTEFLSNSREVHCFDGTNVCRWVKITKQAPQPRRERGRPVEIVPDPNEPVVYVTITSGMHPLGNAGVNVAWLAFCSGTFLKQKGRVIPLPGDEIRGRSDAFGYADKTWTFDDELGLPGSIEMFTSNELLRQSLTDRRLLNRTPPKLVPAGVLVKSGIPALRYSVTASTNYLGWSIPTEFSLLQSQPGENENLWQPEISASGRVTGIREVDDTEGPIAAEKYMFQDFRLHDHVMPGELLRYESADPTVLPVGRLLRERREQYYNLIVE
jgi:hypothetical protein